MFFIKSYIKYPKKNIYDFNDLLARPSYYFADMDNPQELDRFYIEGVIHL